MQLSGSLVGSIVGLLLVGCYVDYGNSADVPVRYGSVPSPYGIRNNPPGMVYPTPAFRRPPIMNHNQFGASVPVRPVAHVSRFSHSESRYQLAAPAPSPCTRLNATAEKQLQAYIMGIEALTAVMQELDEAVQQMRPIVKACELQPQATGPSPAALGGSQPSMATEPSVSARNSPNEPAAVSATPTIAPAVSVPTTTMAMESTMASVSSTAASPELVSSAPVSTGPDSSPASVVATVAAETVAATTTESFTDAPVSTVAPALESRARRDAVAANTTMPAASTAASGEQYFGLPTAGGESAAAGSTQDQGVEDLVKASNDLKTLRKDLANTAEWLKQTNHTVHSVMLRALQAYVTSIERRVDHERQMFAQTRGSSVLKSKIAAIKEKVAALMEKLRQLVPFKQQLGISRDDSGLPSGITTIAPGTFNNNNNNAFPGSAMTSSGTTMSLLSGTSATTLKPAV